ncbi:hypothetical protein ACOBQX_00920 [Actinokineospora sp. G85]|uniref:hypothetical protein n=1 Tax=Actinokineospora sp. G85 TaxID=3406626 RepID=UPI003C735CCC
MRGVAHRGPPRSGQTENTPRAGTSSRVLPLFDGAYADQHEAYDITVPEIVGALDRLFDRWLASDNPVPIAPLDAQGQAALRHLNPDSPKVCHDQRDWLPVIVINTPPRCCPAPGSTPRP